MKIALIGASGFVGSALLKEAARRNHSITAFARNADKIGAEPGVTRKSIDVNDQAALETALAGHDLILSAFNGGWSDPDIYRKHMVGSKAIADTSAKLGVRLIEIGGAGSLYAPDGTQFVDGADFPAQFKQGATAARDVLTALKSSSGLDWTYVSPPFSFQQGTRTGNYRTGHDHPVFDEQGQSQISVEDFAVAVLDEAEKHKFPMQRFTVGY